MPKKSNNLVGKTAVETLDQLESVSDSVQKTLNDTATPIRRHVFSRFPALFLLLVTVGVVATMLGLERLMLEYDILSSHPLILFIIGISILALTGTLYKKLG